VSCRWANKARAFSRCRVGASFVAHAVNVGDMSGSTGTVNVDGVGTSMEIQTDFNVGEQGSGTLNVTNGAQLLNDGDATLARHDWLRRDGEGR